ncbi:MAG: hypothetical protein KF861_18910, partial [Planctomycetaceae bacterium]|nr:hypothetical protein [Planctomycetaceae bacterium]
NIARALPSGLSLADIPGLPDIHSAASNMAATAQRATGAARDTGSSLLKTLLPLAALALLAFLGWQYFRVPAAGPEMTEVAGPITEHTVQKPVIETPASVPDVTQVTQNLTSVFATATDTLRDITDAATAEAALPKLNDLSTQIDGLATLKARLPAAARSTIANLTTDNMGKLTELIEKVLGIPGVKEKLEPVLNGLISKLNALQNNE